MEKWAFDVLGIEQTTDKKAIKKAYALLVKQYHPEEFPEEWKQIHDAFLAAMQYAKGASESRIEEPQKSSLHLDVSYEKEAYDDTFGGIREGIREREQSNFEEACKELKKLSGLSGYRSYRRWKQFFSSDSFKEVSEEILLVMLEILQIHNPGRKAAELIKNTMEDLIRDYSASMQLQKASLAKEIAACCCRGRKKTCLGNEVWVAALIVMIIVFLMIGVESIFSGDTVQQEQKQEESPTIAAAMEYFNGKYQTQYMEEDFEEEDYYLKKYVQGKEKRIGSVVKISGEESTRIYVFSMEEEGAQPETVCFDNRQVEEIAEALESEAEQLTGYADGHLFLNTSLSDEIDDFDRNVFHTCYEGDLQQFFEEETKIRESLHGGYLGNVRAAFYGSDLQLDTMKKRLLNQEDAQSKALWNGLKKLETVYQIQCMGILLPREYYEELMQQEGSKEREDIGWLADVSAANKTEPPVPFVFMTGYYPGGVAKDYETGEFSLFQAIELGEGIYAVYSYFDNESGFFEKIDEGDVKMEQISRTERKSENVETISFQLMGDIENMGSYIIAIDKEQYGVTGRSYGVIVSEYGKGGRDLTTISYTKEGVGYNSSCVWDGGGYLYMSCPSGGDGEDGGFVTLIKHNASL